MTVPIYDFSDRVALVTGGASGIGAATVRRFARSGASVVVADIDMSAAERLVDTILAEGGSAAPVRCDVSHESEVEQMVRFTVETFGRLDHAFNNAGIIGSAGQPTGLFAAETWTRTVGVNLTGVFNCLKHELAHMAEHGGGSIVNTSSTAGMTAAKAGAAYGATKHGVIGLTKTAAKEYLPRGIRVNAVCPGGVSTPLLEGMAGSPVPPNPPGGDGPAIASADEIAEAVVWLCSPASSFVVGQALFLDGGFYL